MVDQCLSSSKPSKALINSSNHLQTRTIWNKQVSKGGFEEYKLRDTMEILTWNCQYIQYAYKRNLVFFFFFYVHFCEKYLISYIIVTTIRLVRNKIENFLK